MSERTYLLFRTEGYSLTDEMRVRQLKVSETGSSGTIRDGVAFEHDNDGWWVLSFKDLESIYLAAKKARES
jgi:hypothetical protein